MRRFLLLLLIPLAVSAEPASPVEARLRDALRQLTARVQTAESDAATARAEAAAQLAKNQALQTSLDQLTKTSAAAKAESEKALTDAQAQLAEHDAELTRTREALDKWKAAHAQITELGRKGEAARVALAEKAVALENRVADLTRKNLALYKLGNEILTRLEQFGYGTALVAREPFVGLTRVKLENEVQGYKDKLLDPKLKP